MSAISPHSNLLPYPTYKPSGIEWLGDVPKHWRFVRAKSVFKPVDVRSVSGEEELLTVSAEHGVIPRKSINVTMFEAASYVGSKLCWPGDLVINSLWAWGRGLGVSNHHGIVSSAYGVYRLLPSSESSPKYVHHLVRSTPFHWELQVRSKGIWISRLQLTDDAFLGSPLPLPPLPEQRAIARYLDYMVHRIQRYIRAKERLIELLEEQKRAVINQAVTRGLDPDVPLKASGVEWLGDVPAHWEVRRLKTLARDVIDLTRDDPKIELRIALENVKSWTGVVENGGDNGVFSSQMKRFDSGDVLFGKLRPYLAKVTQPKQNGLCVGEFLVLRGQDSALDMKYLELLLRSKSVIDEIDAATYGARMPRANWDHIGGLHLPVPPKSEQAKIANHVRESSSRVDSEIARARRQTELIEEYRTRLIADVVTGKLDVRDAAAGLADDLGEDGLLEPSGDLERLEAANIG